MASASVKRSISEISDSNGGENTPPNKKTRNKPKAHRLVYTPGDQMFRIFKPGKQLKVYIRRKYFDFEDTSQNLWGTDLYMVDSDLLAAAFHSGKVKKEDLYPSSVRGVIVGVEIVPGQCRFQGSTHHQVTSKPCSSDNNGFVVHSVKIIDENTGSKTNKNNEKNDGNKLNKQKLFLPNVTVVFNLSNEPCLKYTLNAVADRGHEPAGFTFNRFNNEVLFVETEFNRYELSFSKLNNRFQWARIKSPHSLNQETLSRMPVPLLEDQLEVLHTSLLWKEIEWGPQSVVVRGDEYALARIQFHKHQNPTDPPSTSSDTPETSTDHRSGESVAVKQEELYQESETV